VNKSQHYLNLSKEALNNSRLWLEEANYLLFERQSYEHSLSLSLLSIEEAVKSWICFTVGIGIMEHTEEIVEEVFWRHLSKMESVVFFWLFMNIPLVQKSYLEELDEQEEERLKHFMTAIDTSYRETVKRLNEYRKKGMYVDNPEGKILSPRAITKDEAERFFIDAISFNKFTEMILNLYENASEEEKQEYLDRANRITSIGMDNWKRIIKKEV